MPLTFAHGSKGFTIEGQPPPAPGELPFAEYSVITPDYFRCLQIPVLKGRSFAWSDAPGALPVVMLSRGLAEKYWPGQDPVGKRLKLGGPGDNAPWLTVIGVAGDVRQFNLTTALRQPGTGGFTSWIFYVPMALAGVPLNVFLLVGVAQLFYQFWPHTRHIGRLGALDRWIQTPSNHRVHHAQNDIYLDKNYVGVFLIWDRLFGTFQEELDEEPCIYGIRGQLRSWNPVWANLHYYWAMAQDSWHAASWWDKLRVWVAGPGWRPADVAARYPKQPYDPRRGFRK